MYVSVKFYCEVINNELHSSTTYEEVTDTESDVITGVTSKIQDLTGISVEDCHKCLPSFYWLPKQHKQPIGQRFIAAGRRCCTKQLSQLLTTALKHITKTIKNSDTFKFKYKIGNPFWILDSRDPILNNIKLLNSKNKAHNVNTFDFSTLYTTIPHDELKKAINTLCKEAFTITGKSHLHISRNRAYWCDKNPHTRLEKSYCLTLETLCKWIELLIDNIYVFYGGQVFKQIIGIPMGTDCAPVLANLFLLYYERIYIFNLVEIGDTDTLYKLSNTGRFIDDLISINDKCKLLELLPSIYPSCMTVNKTNQSTKNATYLQTNNNKTKQKIIYLITHNINRIICYKKRKWLNILGN